MLMVGPVIARIEAQVPLLAGRVAGAKAYLRLTEGGAAPQQTAAAYVFPGAVTPRSRDTGFIGWFRQAIDRTVSVVIYLRGHDGNAGGGIPDLEQLVEDVTLALCNWAPAGHDAGVFRLLQSRLLGAHAGTLAWGLDFGIHDDIRIPDA